MVTPRDVLSMTSFLFSAKGQGLHGYGWHRPDQTQRKRADGLFLVFSKPVPVPSPRAGSNFGNLEPLAGVAWEVVCRQ